MTIKKSKSGFSLVEAIIAVAVLGIAVIALMQVFPIGVKTSSLSRKTTVAVNLAQSFLEETSSIPFADIASVTKERVDPDEDSSLYNFYRQIDVTNVDTNLDDTGVDTGLKKIVVTISWTEEGNQKQVQIPTLIAEK